MRLSHVVTWLHCTVTSRHMVPDWLVPGSGTNEWPLSKRRNDTYDTAKLSEKATKFAPLEAPFFASEIFGGKTQFSYRRPDSREADSREDWLSFQKDSNSYGYRDMLESARGNHGSQRDGGVNFQPSEAGGLSPGHSNKWGEELGPVGLQIPKVKVAFEVVCFYLLVVNLFT